MLIDGFWVLLGGYLIIRGGIRGGSNLSNTRLQIPHAVYVLDKTQRMYIYKKDYFKSRTNLIRRIFLTEYRHMLTPNPE